MDIADIEDTNILRLKDENIIPTFVYLMDELYDVFDITDGSLYVRREDRIHIW